MSMSSRRHDEAPAISKKISGGTHRPLKDRRVLRLPRCLAGVRHCRRGRCIAVPAQAESAADVDRSAGMDRHSPAGPRRIRSHQVNARRTATPSHIRIGRCTASRPPWRGPIRMGASIRAQRCRHTGQWRRVRVAASPNLSGVFCATPGDGLAHLGWNELDSASSALPGRIGVAHRFRRKRTFQEVSRRICAVPESDSVALSPRAQVRVVNRQEIISMNRVQFE